MTVLRLILLSTLMHLLRCAGPDFLDPPPTQPATATPPADNPAEDEGEITKSTDSSVVEPVQPAKPTPSAKEQCETDGLFYDDKIFAATATCMPEIKLFSGKQMSCKAEDAKTALSTSQAELLGNQIELIAVGGDPYACIICKAGDTSDPCLDYQNNAAYPSRVLRLIYVQGDDRYFATAAYPE